MSRRIAHRIGLAMTPLAVAGAVVLGAAPVPAQSPAASIQVETAAPVEALKAVFRRPSGSPPGLAPGEAGRAQVALGRRLFFDKRLSVDATMSCATCHDPARGFSDGRAKARGRDGTTLQRNTPTLWNLAWAKSLFWDGRSGTLEEQARVPLEHPNELSLGVDGAVARLSAIPAYRSAFARAFPQPAPRTTGRASPVTADRLLAAIAAYERSLVSPRTRFDRWIDGDARALTPAEIEGFRLFAGKARCLACHGGWRFTDERFHDIGLHSPDPGRGGVPGFSGDQRRFKTPSLRELTRTAPYMHDGSLPDLDAVVRHYAGALDRRASLADELKRETPLTDAERARLVAFLSTLSSDRPARRSR